MLERIVMHSLVSFSSFLQMREQTKSLLLLSSRLVVAGGLTVLIAGCGFHLKGAEHFSPALNTLFIQSQNPNGPMVQTLKQRLTANKIKLAQSSKSATATLNIIHSFQTKQAIGIIGSGQAIRYTLTNTVEFSILGKNKKLVYGPSTVRATQDFSSNASQVLTSKHKTQTIRSRLQQQLANQILQQLTKVKTNQAKTLTNEN